MAARVPRMPGAMLLLSVVCVLFTGVAESAEWQVESADKKSSIRFGYLAVGRMEFSDTAAGETAQDLYFRRLRFLAGGKLPGKWSFFMETDSPNLGKGTSSGSKIGGADNHDLYIQDFVLSYNHGPKLNLDIGMLLIPLSHNSNQSAASLLAHDYGPYSFLQSAPTDSNVGRDYGMSMRGHLADSKLEYRLGLFQGDRGDDSTNDFRYAGRVVYHLFEPETGFFYSGSYLGSKRVLAVGASIDTQEDYTANSLDLFWSQPVRDGDNITVQADWIGYDGGEIFPELPEQDALLLEAGYYFGSTSLHPYVQYASRDFTEEGTADRDQTAVGLAWHGNGHKLVLKIAWIRSGENGTPDRDRFVLQAKSFMF